MITSGKLKYFTFNKVLIFAALLFFTSYFYIKYLNQINRTEIKNKISREEFINRIKILYDNFDIDCTSSTLELNDELYKNFRQTGINNPDSFLYIKTNMKHKDYELSSSNTFKSDKKNEEITEDEDGYSSGNDDRKYSIRISGNTLYKGNAEIAYFNSDFFKQASINDILKNRLSSEELNNKALNFIKKIKADSFEYKPSYPVNISQYMNMYKINKDIHRIIPFNAFYQDVLYVNDFALVDILRNGRIISYMEANIKKTDLSMISVIPKLSITKAMNKAISTSYHAMNTELWKEKKITFLYSKRINTMRCHLRILNFPDKKLIKNYRLINENFLSLNPRLVYVFNIDLKFDERRTTVIVVVDAENGQSYYCFKFMSFVSYKAEKYTWDINENLEIRKGPKM